MPLDRRTLLTASAAFLLARPDGADADDAFAAVMVTSLGEGRPFSASAVVDAARGLSRLPYVPADIVLPARFQNLAYDDYIKIMSRRDRASWSGDSVGFAIEPLHRGFVFDMPVALHLVEKGAVRRVAYSPDQFEYPEGVLPTTSVDTAFSGFRILGGRAGDLVERAIFQGATYFRALAEGQNYGAMARGLSIRTADPEGEEIPAFRAYWIEKPAAGDPLIIHAIADSESMTAAFRFAVRFGDMTTLDTELTVFARTDVPSLGIAGMQTTYFFGPNDRKGFDDVRAAAFENSGLQMWRGNGEWLWRSVSNPAALQISAFVDTDPKGFGFLQRERNSASFEDDNQMFERRPSLWVEPVGAWGAGAVELIEIPTRSDINDNIISYWRPKDILAAGTSRRYAYRQFWCWEPGEQPQGPTVTQTRSGAGATPSSRRFIVAFSGESLRNITADALKIAITLSAGTVLSQRVISLADQAMARVLFEVDLGGATLIEMRMTLSASNAVHSETWLYRWTT